MNSYLVLLYCILQCLWFHFVAHTKHPKFSQRFHGQGNSYTTKYLRLKLKLTMDMIGATPINDDCWRTSCLFCYLLEKAEKISRIYSSLQSVVFLGCTVCSANLAVVFLYMYTAI